MAQKNIAARGRQIMKLAKQIRAKSKGKKWITCVKEAAKKLK